MRNHDPAAALDGGADGLDAYRIILSGAGDFLAIDGLLIVEIGHDQADAVTTLALASGFRLIEARRISAVMNAPSPSATPEPVQSPTNRCQ